MCSFCRSSATYSVCCYMLKFGKGIWHEFCWILNIFFLLSRIACISSKRVNYCCLWNWDNIAGLVIIGIADADDMCRLHQGLGREKRRQRGRSPDLLMSCSEAAAAQDIAEQTLCPIIVLPIDIIGSLAYHGSSMLYNASQPHCMSIFIWLSFCYACCYCCWLYVGLLVSQLHCSSLMINLSQLPDHSFDWIPLWSVWSDLTYWWVYDVFHPSSVISLCVYYCDWLHAIIC